MAKYTDNFKNFNELIPQDIAYLNRIYELQSYRVQIKNFLDTHKPYFMYDGQQYFIEDIASYHIHAGDYARKDKPKGGHSNYGGNKLDCFNPEIIKHGPLGAKDVLFYNSRNANLTKPSSIYPEIWSEFVCDLKAIEVMASANVYVSEDAPGVLTFRGKTAEGLDLVVHYHIESKRVRSHYPDSEKF